MPGGAGRVTNCCWPPAGKRTDCKVEGSMNMLVDLGVRGLFEYRNEIGLLTI